ncbi:amino acid adenylation domain-containing protein [Streptomyces rishiriensis]|uniref:amino acid adenylation domain-containing protein n=1 Tax=Streptomyces rishiriensis TaxID=68264 RepID=UPI0033DF073B
MSVAVGGIDGIRRAVCLDAFEAETLDDLARLVQATVEPADGGLGPDQPVPQPCLFVVTHSEGTEPTTADWDSYAQDAALGIEYRAGQHSNQIWVRRRSGIHPAWLAAQFVRHLARLLAVWHADPSSSPVRVPFLPDDEAAGLLAQAAGPARDPLGRPLDLLFAEQARRTPEQVALIAPDRDNAIRTVSYAELEDRVANLSERLAEVGATGAVPVAVRVSRSVDLVATLLAVLRQGAVYVPVDASYPADYARFIIEDSGARVVVSNDCTPSVAVARAPAAADERPDSGDRTEALAGFIADDPCLLMYTSGSTGRPKGVLHGQRQIINRLQWMWEAYPFEVGDVIAQRSPSSVMPSVWELLGGLLTGHPTVVVPDRIVRQPARFAEFLAAHDVSVITLTPTLLRLTLGAHATAEAWPDRLRMVIVGGERLTDGLYHCFRACFPHTLLIDDFGATEVNTVLHRPLRPEDHGGTDAQGYRPIANASVFVLDNHQRMVPPSVEGELCIAGVPLALGYPNLPDLTATRFCDVQLTPRTPATRVYRTGDMGYLSPDGSIHLTGRRDHQIKVNGMRVELGEVEAVLGTHPGISECAVVGRTETGRTVLAAYVVLRDPATPVRQIRQFLTTRLPGFMVPSRVALMAALPRRPNGKLDRAALIGGSIGSLSNDNSRVGSVELVTGQLRTIVGAILGVDSQAIDTGLEFDSLGVDSVALIEVAARISALTGRRIEPTHLFTHPTIDQLARHVCAAGAGLTTTVDAPARALHSGSDRRAAAGFAIVGMSGQVPGAPDMDLFWQNLRAGVDSISTAPSRRWSPYAIQAPDPPREGRSCSRWGGALAEADRFDAAFFDVSPAEAQVMDPQQRLCLMESWHALEDAGYAAPLPRRGPVGVFVGACVPDYPKLIDRAGHPPSVETLLGNDMSLLAARISYFCDLHGPSLVVDTACSSSLTALHLACRSLRDAECSLALVGGVCVTNDPDFYAASTKLGIVSRSGQCRAFDADADGFVHGEGVAFVVLKALDKAIEDDDYIYAVVSGTAINQDGRSNGITAPSGSAQSALQESLYGELGVDPDDIGYVEAHGTGTQLGDPVEVDALTRSFRQQTRRTRYCAIGSVKTNVGHLTAAAGITSLIKVALCLDHGELVPSVQFDRPNPLIRFEKTPFYVNTECRSWDVPSSGIRTAAINSFGIGGTNVHCVVQERPSPPPRTPPPPGAYPVAVTAPAPSTVRAAVERLLHWLEANAHRRTLRDLSYSLMAGRRIFRYGHICIARSTTELETQLRELLAGRTPRGVVAVPTDPPQHRAANTGASKARKLADLLVGGADIDVNQWFEGTGAHHVPVPTCSFATDRYWVGDTTVGQRLPDEHGEPGGVDQVRDLVRTAAASVLGVEPASIPTDLPLWAHGLDSLRAIRLKHALGSALDLDVPVDCLFDGASVDALAARLAALRDEGGRPQEDDRELMQAFLSGRFDLAHASDGQLDMLHQLLIEAVNDAGTR